MSKDIIEFSVRKMRSKYGTYGRSEYEGNVLVDEHDALVDAMAEQFGKLTAAIVAAKSEAVNAIVKKYEVFVRPMADGHYKLHRRLVNADDFDGVKKMHGYDAIGYGHDQVVEFYRKSGLLCTVECHRGIIIDKTPCSAGDWARIVAGDIPKVFLEKIDGHVELKVVMDPVRSDALELIRMGVTTLEQLDELKADIWTKYKPTHYDRLSVLRSILKQYLLMLASAPTTTSTTTAVDEPDSNNVDNLIIQAALLSDSDKALLIAALS